MKTQLHLLTAIATALGTTLASAQENRPPELLLQARAPEAPRPVETPRPPAPSRPLVPARSAAFLGVATSPVAPALAAQLRLPEGFGLVVDEVMPDSPAGKAGVLRFDVLRLFNDQQLLDPDQLAALVRAEGKDSDVTLTVLRKGQEQKLSVKISERPMPTTFDTTLYGQDLFDTLKDGIDDKGRRLQEQARDYEKRMREYLERLKNWRGDPNAEMPKPPEFRPSSAVESADFLIREFRPGGAAQVQVLDNSGSVTYNTANAKVMMKDDSGSIEVTSTDGRRHLIAKNSKGEVIFDGPIDTPEQLKALPEDLRKKVEAVDARSTIQSITPTGR